MLNLSLFEIQRKWKLYLGVLFFYEMANAALLFKIHPHISSVTGSGGEWVAFVFLLGMVLPVLSVADAIFTLSSEIKQNSRDLYFALPYNGFEKIGSKLLVSGVSMILAMGTYFLTTFASLQFLTHQIVSKLICDAMSTRFDALSYIAIICFISYLVFIATVYLSLAIYKSFFSQVKFGGFMVLIIFIAISYVFDKMTSPLLEMSGHVRNFALDSGVHMNANFWAQGYQAVALQLVTLSVVFVMTSWLFEHRANFD